MCQTPGTCRQLLQCVPQLVGARTNEMSRIGIMWSMEVLVDFDAHLMDAEADNV